MQAPPLWLNFQFFSGTNEKPTLAPGRPKCNAILHLFGKWLFEAAFIGTKFSTPSSSASGKGSDSHISLDKRSASLSIDSNSSHRRVSSSSQNSVSGHQSLSVTNDTLELPAALTPERFESGRAEALGTLCRIMCAKKSSEDILPLYLARFYLAVEQGLYVPPVNEIPNRLNQLKSKDLLFL